MQQVRAVSSTCSMLLVDMMIAHSLVAKKPVACLSATWLSKLWKVVSSLRVYPSARELRKVGSLHLILAGYD